MDKLFSEIVRSIGQCEKCGSKTNLQCAHIYSRRYRNTRWDSLNALCLCAGCHFWAHQNPLDFAKFVEERLGEGTCEEIRQRAHSISHVDYEAVYENLKNIAERS